MNAWICSVVYCSVVVGAIQIKFFSSSPSSSSVVDKASSNIKDGFQFYIIIIIIKWVCNSRHEELALNLHPQPHLSSSSHHDKQT